MGGPVSPCNAEPRDILFTCSVPHLSENPPNRFQEAHVDWDGEAPPADLQVHEEQAKSALSENKSPDVGFRWSVNPYRGCFHGCAYCYARPTHPYLGFGAGTDFERQIVVKVNIVDRLRAALRKKSWKRELVAFSGNTDCYQPIESHYQLTRRCLEVCAELQTPVTIITKGKLVRRDVDVLQALQRESGCRVTLSIPFANDVHARAIEPFASPPSKRFETLRILSDAGVDTAVAVAPIIPGLNDDQIPEILKRARDAGASAAFKILLRLPLEVGPVFSARLAEAFPLRHAKVMSAIHDMRGGGQNDARFGARMVGQGPRWAMTEKLFSVHCDRLGLEYLAGEAARPARVRPPDRGGPQLPLLF
ncbi:MAG: PA0069 family radical SAM protein [Deltaproteobacteria bacterium]|nr:MAG: PA0069 family radical SAM protein [Deltaproteobacteria bacterium]